LEGHGIEILWKRLTGDMAGGKSKTLSGIYYRGWQVIKPPRGGNRCASKDCLEKASAFECAPSGTAAGIATLRYEEMLR